jgi:hypothetical protein
VELDQLELAVAVGCSHEREVAADALEPDDPVDPVALDRALAANLEPKLGEERGRRGEIFDDDADVVHPLDCHGRMVRNPGSSRGSPRRPVAGVTSRARRADGLRVCAGFREAMTRLSCEPASRTAAPAAG